MIDTVIIQPPIVQLNTPYPSGAYLKSFFSQLYDEKKLEGNVTWVELNTKLFHKIFSPEGLNKIFTQSKDRVLELCDFFLADGDENSAYQLKRFMCSSHKWIQWIDTIKAIVCPSKDISGKEFTHEFIRSAHVPRGMRMENYMENLDREVGAEDAQILATLAFADLSDYITLCYDKNFSLIQYAEYVTGNSRSFSEIENELDSPVLKNFLEEILIEELKKNSVSPDRNTLFCISVPFAGTFTPALYCARALKKLFKERCLVALGGGFVNTELRNTKEKNLFSYCDFLSYDKGYGSYIELSKIFSEASHDDLQNLFSKKYSGKHFYKTKYLDKTSGLVASMADRDIELEAEEKKYVKKIIPDFSSFDFTLCPRLSDDVNPMHRIWNDGAWIKAYMAYGCYWHRCTFCDTSLDYVNNFCSTEYFTLHKGLLRQAEKTGVYGIHFVDEACPPVGLQNFAIANCSSKKQRLTFWGNIRFEKTFSRDLADILSYGGLTAVSAGLEIATNTGLDTVNKGTDMENIISACCAFKEAGILIHSYMIFGYWNQSESDLINSMETLRQMFEAGLLDSAFFHKFSLTRHSTVYREWEEGKHPDLVPLTDDTSFTENEIHFKGEKKSEKYSAPLNMALNDWMHGRNLDRNVESYFPFKMPRPGISKKFVERFITKYEEKRNAEHETLPPENKKIVWLGGNIILQKTDGKKIISWTYMGELIEEEIFSRNPDEIVDALNRIRIENFNKYDSSFEAKNILNILGKKTFLKLRGQGLCALI